MSAPRTRDDTRSHHWRRRLRPAVFLRDGGICAICQEPIDPTLPGNHPRGYHLDHGRGAGTGYDPRYLRATHNACNVKQGDPTRTGDPKPKRATKW